MKSRNTIENHHIYSLSSKIHYYQAEYFLGWKSKLLSTNKQTNKPKGKRREIKREKN